MFGGAAPKTAGSFTADQHVRITDVVVLKFVDWACSNLEDEEPLWPWPAATYSARWSTCLELLQTPSNSVTGYTPASLRAGAACWLYVLGELSLDEIRWMLRHTSQRNLESYIQELPASMSRARGLSSKARRFSDAFEAVMDEAPALHPTGAPFQNDTTRVIPDERRRAVLPVRAVSPPHDLPPHRRPSRLLSQIADHNRTGLYWKIATT